jgi:hypothetical protein
MLLKKIYKEDGKTVDYLKVLKITPIQKFSPRFINAGLDGGYLSFTKEKITLTSKPNDLVYNVKETPGFFCCFDNERMANGTAAQAYILENFPGQKSPDPQNPSGYRKDNFYLCELQGET